MINDILLSRLGTNGSFGLEKRKEKKFELYGYSRANKEMPIFMENLDLKTCINDKVVTACEYSGIMGKLDEKRGMTDSWKNRLFDFILKILDKIVEFLGFITGLRVKPKDISAKCVKMIKDTIDKNPLKIEGILPIDVFSTAGWSTLLEQGTPADRDKTNDRDTNRYSKQFNPRPEEAKDKGKSDYPWKTQFDSAFTNNFAEIFGILRNVMTSSDKDGFLDDTVMRQIKRIGNNSKLMGLDKVIKDMSLTQIYYQRCYKLAMTSPVLEIYESNDPLNPVYSNYNNMYKEMLKRCKSIEQQAVLTDAGGMVNSTSVRRFKTLKRWLTMRRTFLDNVTKSPEYKSDKIHYRVQNEYKCIAILNDFFTFYNRSLLQVRQLYNDFSKTAMSYTQMLIKVYNLRVEENEKGGK